MDRDSFLHLLRDRRARFHAVLTELGLSIDSDDDAIREVGGGWALAEHLIHIAAWERRFNRQVTSLPKTSPYPSNWQKFNDAVYAEWRGVEPAAARAEYSAAHDGLVAAVSALPLREIRRAPSSSSAGTSAWPRATIASMRRSCSSMSDIPSPYHGGEGLWSESGATSLRSAGRSLRSDW